MIAEAKAMLPSDPYHMTRMARFSDQNHPFLFIRGEICDIDTGEETDSLRQNEYDVATLAMWDTGNDLTVVCAEYLGISVPEKTLAIMSFQ